VERDEAWVFPWSLLAGRPAGDPLRAYRSICGSCYGRVSARSRNHEPASVRGAPKLRPVALHKEFGNHPAPFETALEETASTAHEPATSHAGMPANAGIQVRGGRVRASTDPRLRGNDRFMDAPSRRLRRMGLSP